jgi:hypothetical protein
VVDILPTSDSYTVDHSIDRCNYVSLSELELRNIVGESDIPDLDLADWDPNAYKDHTGLAFSMQDLDSVTLQIVPGLYPSPSTRSHDIQQSETYDTMHRASNLHDRESQRPSAAVKDWYLAHSTSPYPSPDEVQELAMSSGLTERQVKICLSNLRARSKDGKYKY